MRLDFLSEIKYYGLFLIRKSWWRIFHHVFLLNYLYLFNNYLNSSKIVNPIQAKNKFLTLHPSGNIKNISSRLQKKKYFSCHFFDFSKYYSCLQLSNNRTSSEHRSNIRKIYENSTFTFIIRDVHIERLKFIILVSHNDEITNKVETIGAKMG